jgi:Fe-S cluster biosynthesis and repair protein YggX
MDDARIEQFQKMANDDPDNELGHFSLGKALLDAGRAGEAVASFERVLEINGQNSKAYQLLAAAQIKAGKSGDAIATLRLGFDVANSRGDLMPRNEMAAMMRELGETPPEVEETPGGQPRVEAGEGQVHCKRCNQVRPALKERPFKGQLGEQVLANICQSCWTEWIHMGTKIINELRLNFADPQHASIYDQHMKEFLNLR